MLMEFCMLVWTLKRRIPEIERGILFREPTRLQQGDNVHIRSSKRVKCNTFGKVDQIPYLYVVALVCRRNHIEVKLIARPKTPLAVMTNQNIGILSRGLQIHFP
jgi:hypothetical protein